MEWADDAIRIYFANSKTDQQGAQSKFPRHVYSNPIDWVICPIFALGMYLCRFNTAVESNSRLFPGHHQFKRFANLLKQVLRSHEDELLDLQICWEDIGTHFLIRKGVATSMSSFPGAISVPEGWSMSKAKDFISDMSRVGTCLLEGL